MLNQFKKTLLEKYPFFNHFFNFNYGLLPEEKDERDFQLGASPIQKKVIRRDGQWNNFLPAEERQSR